MRCDGIVTDRWLPQGVVHVGRRNWSVGHTCRHHLRHGYAHAQLWLGSTSVALCIGSAGAAWSARDAEGAAPLILAATPLILAATPLVLAATPLVPTASANCFVLVRVRR